MIYTNTCFIMRNIYGKYILMPIKNNAASNDPILLNEVGAYIWNSAEKHISLDNLLNNTAERYNLNIDSPELMAVKEFVYNMLHMGLLFKEDNENG